MNLEQLLAHTRTLADDAAGAQLWSDEDLTAYLNDAQRQACIRAKLLQEISGATYCEIALVEGQREYELHPLVLEVMAAKRRGDYNPLDPAAVEALRFPVERGGHPMAFAVYGQKTSTTGMKLLLDRPAAEDGVLDLDIFRLPVEDMEDPADEPEIDIQHHEHLVYWALHKAYLRRDYDAEDIDRASLFEGKFINHFGFLPDANVMRKQRRRQVPVTRNSRLR